MNGSEALGREIKVEFAKGNRDRNDRGDRGGFRGDRGGRDFDRGRRDFGDRPKGCFNCQEEGHFARDCPKRKSFLNQPANPESSIVTVMIGEVTETVVETTEMTEIVEIVTEEEDQTAILKVVAEVEATIEEERTEEEDLHLHLLDLDLYDLLSYNNIYFLYFWFTKIQQNI